MITDIATVKTMIQYSAVQIPNVYNERLVLSLFGSAQLPHAAIASDSVSVKAILENDVTAETNNPITLNDQDVSSLSYNKIVWDSVIVASDLALTTVYVENEDYIIDYFSGTIRRCTGTAITDGQAVYVWYIPFTVYTEGSDYNIDYDYGTINRRAGTDIPSGATVYVDYSHTQTEPTDAAIEEAIEQAESWILQRLKGNYDIKSTDKALKAGATSLVLHILSLASSFRVLTSTPSDEADSLARQWHQLSGRYLSLALAQLSKFIKVSSLDAGGVINNRFASTHQRTKVNPTIRSTQRKY